MNCRVAWFSFLMAAALFASGCKSTGPLPSEPGPGEWGYRGSDTSKTASAHAHFAAGVVHEFNDEIEPALAEFRKAVEEDPDDETLVLEVTRRFLQNKQPEKALEILEFVTRRSAATGEVYARLGQVLNQLGRKEEALVASRTAVKKSPDAIAGYQNLFAYYLKASQAPEALKVLEDAGKRQNVDAEFLIGLADLYRAFALQFPTQREMANERGAAALVRAEAMKPTSPMTRLRLADGLYAVGKTDKAAPVYLGLLNQMDEMPMVLEAMRARLADIYLKGNDSKLAREQLEAIVKADPANAQAYYFLGSIAYEERNWTNAIEHLQKTVLLKPGFEQAYYDLAGAQLAADKAEDASETLRSAKRQFPTKFITEYLMALASQNLKNYADAASHFTAAEVMAKAGETKPLDGSFYFQSGIAHERKGDREQAAKLFEKALELQPDFPEAQNYLGYMWAEHGENLDRAKELIEKALKAEPKSAAYLDSMGWVLFKQNQPKPALEYLLKAIENSEEPDATLYDHLGDIYAALNEIAKAREAWEKSLAVEANDAVKKKLEAKNTP